MCTHEEQIDLLKIRIRKLEETTREELGEAVRNLKSELDFRFKETERYSEICKSNHEEVHEDLLKIMSDFKESLDELYIVVNGKAEEEEEEEEDKFDNES